MDEPIELPIGDWVRLSREELLAMASTMGDTPEFWLLVGFICGRYFNQPEAASPEMLRALTGRPS